MDQTVRPCSSSQSKLVWVASFLEGSGMLLSEGASHKPSEKITDDYPPDTPRRLAQGNQATQAERRNNNSWYLGTGQELGNLEKPLGAGLIVKNEPGGFRCESGWACRSPFFSSAEVCQSLCELEKCFC